MDRVCPCRSGSYPYYTEQMFIPQELKGKDSVEVAEWKGENEWLSFRLLTQCQGDGLLQGQPFAFGPGGFEFILV